MNTDQLFTQLNFIAPLSDSLQEHLRRYLVQEHFPKKHILLNPGQTAKRIYFVNSGFARAYYHTLDGKECTSWFMGENDLMISVYSFYTQTPAQEYIELLEESELLSMTWSQLQAIYADHPEYNFIGRLITEKYYILSEARAILLRTLSARDRYERLIELHPNIMQKASSGQVASYLGITGETLSRIRSKPNNARNTGDKAA